MSEVICCSTAEYKLSFTQPHKKSSVLKSHHQVPVQYYDH